MDGVYETFDACEESDEEWEAYSATDEEYCEEDSDTSDEETYRDESGRGRRRKFEFIS